MKSTNEKDTTSAKTFRLYNDNLETLIQLMEKDGRTQAEFMKDAVQLIADQKEKEGNPDAALLKEFQNFQSHSLRLFCNALEQKRTLKDSIYAEYEERLTEKDKAIEQLKVRGEKLLQDKEEVSASLSLLQEEAEKQKTEITDLKERLAEKELIHQSLLEKLSRVDETRLAELEGIKEKYFLLQQQYIELLEKSRPSEKEDTATV